MNTAEKNMTQENTAASELHTLPPKDDAIFGVGFKYLKTHRDGRGFFREIIRFNDAFFSKLTATSKGSESGSHCFGQWSHSRMQKNVVKAWHYHHIQYDWWYLASGQAETVLYDNRPESPTYKKKLVFTIGDSEEFPNSLELCVRIPPGVLHGLKVLSPEAHLFYITSETYNPNEEGRIKYNSDQIDHDWGQDVIVVENDKRDFTPTSTRSLISL